MFTSMILILLIITTDTIDTQMLTSTDTAQRTCPCPVHVEDVAPTLRATHHAHRLLAPQHGQQVNEELHG